MVLSMLFALFIDPILTENLISVDKDLGNYAGYFLAIFASTYTLIAFFVAKLTKRFGAHYISLFSYVTISIACLILGPSNFFFPNNCYVQKQNCIGTTEICEAAYTLCNHDAKTITLTTMIVGLLVLGLGTGTVVVPILVDMT